MSRAERLLRQHIDAAVNSRRVTHLEAARELSDLIEKDHPNKALALQVGLKMHFEQQTETTSR